MSCFRTIVKQNTYVDKTMLISDVIRADKQVLLITCPRRFSKSLNMNMIKTFLKIQLDKEGRVIDRKSTEIYELFSEKNDKQLLLVKNEKQLVDDHLANYPVIYVDFCNAKDDEYESILHGVRYAISNAFEEHGYMINVFDKIINDPNVDKKSKEDANNSLNTFKRLFFRYENATENDLIDSLSFLSKILYNHFKKKVYVLIDEYDAPVNGAMQYRSAGTAKVKNLMDGIMRSVFEGDGRQYLERGIMTGILGMAKESASPEFNNVFEYKFLQSHKYAKYYGLTENEVNMLFDCLKKTEVEKREAKRWYNGYETKSVDDQGEQEVLSIYNPWSITKYFRTSTFNNKWEQSFSINHIEDVFKIDGIRKEIQRLLNGEEITFELKHDLTLDDLKQLQQLLKCKKDEEVSREHVALFFSYIFQLGFLAYGDNKNSYKIPNKEIHCVFAKKIIIYELDTPKFSLYSGRLFENAVEAFNKCNSDTMSIDAVEEFKKAITKYINPLILSDFFNSEEPGAHPNDNLFHSIIAFVVLQSMKSSKSQGYGVKMCKHKTDIVLTNNEDKFCVILNVKYNISAEESLELMETYPSIFDDNDNIRKIKLIGISISPDKIVDIKCRMYTKPPITNI